MAVVVIQTRVGGGGGGWGSLVFEVAEAGLHLLVQLVKVGLDLCLAIFEWVLENNKKTSHLIVLVYLIVW